MSNHQQSPLSFEEALQAWRNCLGEEHVSTSSEDLQKAATATFSTTQTIPAILRPQSREEVQSCVNIANRSKTPLYPISCGKNWGLGSRVPSTDGCVLLDLGRMKKITQFDETMGSITVEPGVSFQQVYTYLNECSSQLYLSVIGGSPDASLIGNALERGDGIGPYGERQVHVCALEVILPTGECITTGFGQFAETNATQLYQWGLGPSLDGLFSQSNLGIVTKMTVWLMPKPPFIQLFFCTLSSQEQMQGALEEARKMMLSHTLAPNCLNIWNVYKLVARQQQYPFEQTFGATPLYPNILGLEPWYITGAIYAQNAQHANVLAEIVESQFVPHVDSIQMFDQESHPEILEENPFLGIPSDINITSTYWRKRFPIPKDLDPDRDRCGVSWLCPLLPFRAGAILQAIDIAESTMLAHGFEPNLGMSCPSGRCLRMFIALTYDRDAKGADERAQICHDELLRKLVGAGFYPYRMGIQSMAQIPPRMPAYERLLTQLKQALDPQEILAPGRYLPIPQPKEPKD